MKNWSFLTKTNEFFDYGVIKYDEYLKNSKQPLNENFGWVKSIVVFTFPYNQVKRYDKYTSAKYAYGSDYHLILDQHLEKLIKEELKHNSFKYEIKIDVNYLDEKLCAYLAGLGSFGKNNLIISPHFGSFMVLATVLTDYEFNEYSETGSFNPCQDCSRCIKSCPTKALSGGYQRRLCLSYLTQYTSNEFKLYDHIHNTFVGCDICQDVCPYNNKEVKILPEFKFNDLSILSLEKLENIEPKDFKKIYSLKAFNWIGFLKVLRNILVLEVNNKNITSEKLEYYQKKYQNEKWFFNHLEYLKEKLKCQ